MGVPKFYRWLSERYPCLSQVIKVHQIPEFDNLYLDMNGIIHPCSHPNDDDPHFRITEAEIFQNIFNYIEVLFRIIKPKKNFFMAVDGCAPRAKMNQQRSRRFRTAKEAENNIRKAQMKGQVLPKEDRFDSNCITPGTEFMARLQVQLQYFVNMKISTDPMWQECTVYLSGHDVPGEGEHKVMDFIRYCKAQPGYDPNTRHCLYGLDADLVMLGLTSHEPHFALLREEVRFGKQTKRITKAEHQTFHLLHLSLLREYLEFEFGVLKGKLHFEFDIEQIIDDWILLGFLVGNDFVPHLPQFHINHDALPYLYGVYKEFLETTDGYLHNGGYINLHRLKKFFEFLSKFDRNNFTDKYEESKWLQSKRTGQLLQSSEKPRKKKGYHNDSSYTDNSYSALEDDSYSYSPKKPMKDFPSSEVDIEMDDEEAFELEFKQHKRHYYMEKFEMDIVDDTKIQKICYEYVLALQWIAHYYFNGLQSWSWYYPYHYSPFISDVANFAVQELRFNMGHPFKPFEQLLAVLPSASRRLLPTAFQNLMIMDTSPIIDYYPPDFRTDLNGKQQEWEAVVLIPFIDEKRLLNAMEKNYSGLTDEEKFRNSFGKCYEYNFDKSLNFIYPSSYPDVFEDIRCCKAKKESLDRTMFHMDPRFLKKGLMEGTQLDVYFPGFPTMRHLKHTTYLKKAGVKVFQYNSRSENMIIKVQDHETKDLEKYATAVVGEVAFVEWPYLVEAKVVSVANEEIKYYLDKENKLQSELLKQESFDRFKKEMNTVCLYMKNRKGIEVGQSNIIVEAIPLLGKRYICSSDGSVRIEKEHSKESIFYPSKIVVKNLAVHKSQQKEYKTVEALYPSGSISFMKTSPHYGCSGEVIEFDKETKKVRLAVKVLPEPSFDKIIDDYDSLSICYLNEHVVAQKLRISVYILNRITGDLMVNENHDNSSRVNIGLKIKYSGQKKEAVGFARLCNDNWTYSSVTINMLREYLDRFPEVFETLGSHHRDASYVLEDFSKKKHFLQDVKGFLKTLPCFKVETVRCGSNVLDKPVIDSIHQEIEAIKVAQKEEEDKDSKPKIVKLKVKPNLIFRPTDQFGKLSPDPTTEFFLFDRVVNVDKGITVPLGLRGTVVGIHKVPTDENDHKSPSETRYEVLFDQSFLGGNNVRTIEGQGYYMSGHSLLNISYGERKDTMKKGEKLTDIMKFQRSITEFDNKSNASPIKHSTPNQKSRYSQDRYYGKSPNDSQEHSWLKGRYQSPNQRQSPHQRGGNKRRDDHNDRRSSSNTSSNDFMNMWNELKKEEENQSNSSPTPTEKVNQDATKTLHKILKINQPGQSPAQPQSVQSATEHQSPSQQTPNTTPIQLLKRPQPAMHQPPSPMSNQPKGAAAAPPFMQPTMVLLQCCNHMRLPQPVYLSTKHQQGYQGFISIGERHFSGQICLTQPEALENVATIAFCELTGFKPNFQKMQPLYEQQHPQQFLRYRSPHQPSPQQPSPKQQSPRYPQQQQRQQTPRNQGGNRFQKSRQSHSDTSLTSKDRMQPKANPFIPHQVSIKNAKSSPAAPKLTSNAKAEEDLKDLLGIQAPDSSAPTTNTKVEAQQCEGDLKRMLGIGPSKDDVLKSMLGVKPSTEIVPAVAVPDDENDDVKLMNLIGVKPMDASSREGDMRQSSSAPSLPSNMKQIEASSFEDDIQLDQLVADLSLGNLKNMTKQVPLFQEAPPPKPQTPPKPKDTQMPTSSVADTAASNKSRSTPSPSSAISGANTPSKPILLAPSFFGPKKK